MFIYVYKYICNIVYLENVFIAKMHLYNMNMIQKKLAQYNEYFYCKWYLNNPIYFLSTAC